MTINNNLIWVGKAIWQLPYRKEAPLPAEPARSRRPLPHGRRHERGYLN